MTDLLRDTIAALQGIRAEYVVFIVSALPIFEIRGGVLAGVWLELPLWRILVYGFLGNIASVTPLLLFLEPITKWLYGNRLADRLFHWLFERARRKAGIVNRWGMLGLLLFVAIPAPGTGAWTGTLVAVVLGIHRGRAIAAVYPGIIIAGLITSLLALGIVAGAKTIAATP